MFSVRKCAARRAWERDETKRNASQNAPSETCIIQKSKKREVSIMMTRQGFEPRTFRYLNLVRYGRCVNLREF